MMNIKFHNNFIIQNPQNVNTKLLFVIPLVMHWKKIQNGLSSNT